MSIAILDLATQLPATLRAPLAFIRAHDPDLSCRAERLSMVLVAELSQAYLCERIERMLHLSLALGHAADLLGCCREAWCFEVVEPFRKQVGELSDLALHLHQQLETEQRDIDWACEMGEADGSEPDSDEQGDSDPPWPTAERPLDYVAGYIESDLPF